MTPAQIKARIAEVDELTLASVQHTEDLRRPSSILDQRWAFDESCCSSPRCSCQRAR